MNGSIQSNGTVQHHKIIYNWRNKSTAQIEEIIRLEAIDFISRNPGFEWKAPAKSNDGKHGALDVILTFVFNPKK